MADCKYCGKPAGFIHRKHAECEAAYLKGQSQVARALDDALAATAVPESLPRLVARIAESSFISQAEQRKTLVEAWSRALDGIMEHGLPDDSAQVRLIQFKKTFKLTELELSAPDAYPRLVKAATLFDLAQGKVPQRFNVTGSIPVNLQKGEQVVWAFWNTNYVEDVTHREYVGASAGVSMRVMKGVYFHTSSFRGRPIDVTTTRQVDSGFFAATQKNLYFAGTRKSMRIPFAKIVSFQSFSDGIGLIRDAANAKRQAFLTGDGWFVYNLVTNLAKL